MFFIFRIIALILVISINTYEFDKNANSNDVCIGALRPISHSVSLATIGVCVFCAVTSVAALFILGGEKMNAKDNSLLATEKFINRIKLKRKFVEFKVNIEVTNSEGGKLCDSVCDCRFSDDIANMNRVLYIYWGFNDDVMRQLNLHEIGRAHV